MNSKTYSAEQIFNKLKTLQTELEDLARAHDYLMDEQKGGIAFKVIKEQHTKQLQELTAYKSTKFTELEESGFFD